jgi:hypothetical protein
MIMKKLIAIAVVFALAAGSMFAADLGASVFGKVKVFEGNTIEGSKAVGSGSMERIRLEGSGENDDGTFGGWLRFDGNGGFGGHGIAWWKPIDQFKVSIGGNPDGIYGKEGWTGWMYYQSANDSVTNNGNTWGGGIGGAVFRTAFFHGFDGEGLMLDITPMDMLGVHIALPYIPGGGEIKELFKSITAQLDFNLDFGNIAITYRGTGNNTWFRADPTIYAYFNLTAVENLSLDLGIGFELPNADTEEKHPMAIGLGVKYDISDAFGLKARALFHGLAGEKGTPLNIVVDLMPYYGISDSVVVFFDLGLAIMSPDVGDSMIGWRLGPYLRVGQEWGPSFFAGFFIWSNGKGAGSWDTGSFVPESPDPDKAVIRFEVPIGIQVSF